MLYCVVLPVLRQEGKSAYFVLTEMFPRELPESQEATQRLDEILDGDSRANDDQEIDDEERVAKRVVYIADHDGET